MPATLTRRRLLQIAAAAPLALAPFPARAASSDLHRWRGVALGAEASILLQHPDAEFAHSVFEQCATEIRRLERVFSLHDSGSALSRLNRDGALEPAPPDLRRLLCEALDLGRATEGAFNCAVQPLWDHYAAHFADPTRSARDPRPPAGLLRLIDDRAVEIDPEHVRFARAGMAVTLNGIAQGYITDRIAGLLRARGFRNVLVNMGEFFGAGAHPEGRPWRVGIADPDRPWDWIEDAELQDSALATSGGYGSPFEPSARHHHLFDPMTGTSANHYRSVSVRAPTAALADGLSTALFVAPPARTGAILARFPQAGALIIRADGTRLRRNFT